MKCQSLLAVLLACACLPSVAADWQWAASSDGALYSMDFDSLSTSGPYKKAWVKANFATAQLTDDYPKKSYRSQMMQYYFDCKGRTLHVTRVANYEKLNFGGEVVQSSSTKFDPRYLNEYMPDTVGERLFSVACATPAMRAKLKTKNQAEEVELLKQLAAEEKGA